MNGISRSQLQRTMYDLRLAGYDISPYFDSPELWLPALTTVPPSRPLVFSKTLLGLRLDADLVRRGATAYELMCYVLDIEQDKVRMPEFPILVAPGSVLRLRDDAAYIPYARLTEPLELHVAIVRNNVCELWGRGHALLAVRR